MSNPSAPSLRRLCALAVIFSFQVCAQTNILTNRYNQQRTAANLNETILTTSNVNTTTFGKLGTYSVDGVIYAQPLYVQGLTINGASHNVLFVATMHDVLYAFDADKVGSAPLWTLDFRSATVQPAPIHIGSNPSSDNVIADTFGIFGTPVIDLPNNRMFFVTHTLESGVEYFRLRNVNILTGALNASTVITASVAASGSYAAQTFIPSKYAQRPALELVSGQVWVAFGSRPPGDYTAPWEGWVMTYSAATLAQTGVFVTSRTNGNSVWQSGGGPAVDASGNVYYLTGNGGTYTPGLDLPESLLQFNGTGGTLKNWYTPDSTVNNDSNNENYTFLDNYDLDLSCNGPMLIPGTSLVTFGGKTADVFLLNTNDLGQLTPNDAQVLQTFHVGASLNVEANDSDRIVGMAYWQQGTAGTLFVWPGLSELHSYSLNTKTSQFTQAYAGTLALPGQPATALAVSANGSNNGILWAPVMNTSAENNVVGQAGILHAYNASNPAQELWNSSMLAADNMGTLAKFVPPVVVNGKVYMANSASLTNWSAGSVTVFGLRTGTTTIAPPAATPTCAVEGGTCFIPPNAAATVYYGAGTKYIAEPGVTGSLACSNTTFGDPDPGVGKACYAVVTSLPSNAVNCSAENATCSLPAGANVVVYFGAGNSYFFTAANGSVSCSDATFGDPDYGVVKACYKSVSTQICAQENGTCSIPTGATATVYYGAGANFTSKTALSGAVSCSNTTFGDPDVGTVKACYLVVTALPAGAVNCAAENGTCAIPAGSSASVFYGAANSYFIQTNAVGSLSCSNQTFGDPSFGTVKACFRH